MATISSQPSNSAPVQAESSCKGILDAIVGQVTAEPHVDAQTHCEVLDIMAQRLAPPQEYVVAEVTGLHGQVPQNYVQVAESMDTSPREVRKIEAEALRILQKGALAVAA